MLAKVYDRTAQPVVYRTLGKTSDERLSRIYFIVLYFVAERSFTADGGPLQPTGGCKDNTSKDPFSQCELYKEFAYKSKLNKCLQRQEFN